MPSVKLDGTEIDLGSLQPFGFDMLPGSLSYAKIQPDGSESTFQLSRTENPHFVHLREFRNDQAQHSFVQWDDCSKSVREQMKSKFRISSPEPEIRITPFVETSSNGTMKLKSRVGRFSIIVTRDRYNGLTNAAEGVIDLPPEERPTITQLGSSFGIPMGTASLILRYAGLSILFPTTYEYELHRSQKTNPDDIFIPSFKIDRKSDGTMKICDNRGQIAAWVNRKEYESVIKYGKRNVTKDPAERLTVEGIAQKTNTRHKAQSILSFANLSSYKQVNRPAEVELVW